MKPRQSYIFFLYLCGDFECAVGCARSSLTTVENNREKDDNVLDRSGQREFAIQKSMKRENAYRYRWHWIDARVLALVDLTHSPRSIERALARSFAHTNTTLEIVKRALWIYFICILFRVLSSFLETFYLTLLAFLSKRKKNIEPFSLAVVFFLLLLLVVVFLTRNKFFPKYVVSAPANKQSCDRRETRR